MIITIIIIVIVRVGQVVRYRQYVTDFDFFRAVHITALPLPKLKVRYQNLLVRYRLKTNESFKQFIIMR